MLATGNRSSSSSLDVELSVLRECASLCLVSSELLVLSLLPDGPTSRRLADWHAIYRNYYLTVPDHLRDPANLKIVMFTAATVFLAAVRAPVLQEKSLQSRFRIFRQDCVDLLGSTALRNTLVSQLESLLDHMQNVLGHSEQDRESSL